MPGYGQRFWADRTADSRRRAYSKFRGAHTADVVVVGGGLTGCASASALAQAGFDVVLLEAERIASGSTAGSLGMIVPQPDAVFHTVAATAGLRVARVAWQESRRAAREFAAALAKLPVKCDLAPAPFLINANTAETGASLKKEQQARKGADVDAPWITAAASREATGSDSAGAIRVRDGYTYDPVRAALGLAGAAESRGARIFEHSPVRRTRFTRKYADVLLTSGSIRTRGIVVATGEPGTIVGQLRRHVRRHDGFVVVTAPLSAAMRREFGSPERIVTEAGDAPHWWRGLPDGRVLFAGALSRPVPDRLRDKAIVQRTAQLMYELSVRYPSISGLPAQWGWHMPVVSTPDTLPWIGPHRNYPFHFLALGFGWQGDAMAWLAARAAVRHFKGNATKDDAALGFARFL